MSTWAIVAVVGALSLALRALPLLWAEALRPGPQANAALRHAGVGALTALLVTAVLGGSSGRPGPGVGLVLAVAVGAVLAWRGWPLLAVVSAGAAAYLGASLVAAL